MSEIKIFNTPEILSLETALYLNLLTKEFINNHGHVNIALSGGSTPKKLFEVLKESYLNVINWEKISFYWVDERCVSPDNPESNFGEADRILFKYLPDKSNIHRIKGEDDSDSESERYSDLLKNNLKSENGFPVLDLILLGLGEDGHTASIFPDQMQLLLSDKICKVAFNPYSGQKRITLTGKVLNNAKNLIFMVTGKNKAEVVKNIFDGNKESINYPASYIKNENEVIWYIDKEAGSFL